MTLHKIPRQAQNAANNIHWNKRNAHDHCAGYAKKLLNKYVQRWGAKMIVIFRGADCEFAGPGLYCRVYFPTIDVYREMVARFSKDIL